MEILKEKIKIKKQSALGNMQARQDEVEKFEWQGVATGYQMSLNIIDKELQDYTFPRVPKREKLSNIITRFSNPNVFYNKEYDSLYITNLYNKSTFNSVVLAKVIDNKLEPTSFAYGFKWLYEYWINGTFIEVDV